MPFNVVEVGQLSPPFPKVVKVVLMKKGLKAETFFLMIELAQLKWVLVVLYSV